jgi:hypothetical protein
MLSILASAAPPTITTAVSPLASDIGALSPCEALSTFEATILASRLNRRFACFALRLLTVLNLRWFAIRVVPDRRTRKAWVQLRRKPLQIPQLGWEEKVVDTPADLVRTQALPNHLELQRATSTPPRREAVAGSR